MAFDEVVSTIERAGAPPASARTLAALFEHYGRRAGEPLHDAELRKALISYLDRYKSEFGPDDFVPHIDQADVLLATLEERRGGVWPLVGETNEDGRVVPGLTIQLERPMGWSEERGSATDDSMLLVLGVALLQGYEALSDSGAIERLASIRGALGDRGTQKESSVRSQYSRAKKQLLDALDPKHRPPFEALGTLSPADRSWPRGVRRAYEARAARIQDGTMVNLRNRRPASRR